MNSNLTNTNRLATMPRKEMYRKLFRNMYQRLTYLSDQEIDEALNKNINRFMQINVATSRNQLKNYLSKIGANNITKHDTYYHFSKLINRGTSPQIAIAAAANYARKKKLESMKRKEVFAPGNLSGMRPQNRSRPQNGSNLSGMRPQNGSNFNVNRRRTTMKQDIETHRQQREKDMEKLQDLIARRNAMSAEIKRQRNALATRNQELTAKKRSFEKFLSTEKNAVIGPKSFYNRIKGFRSKLFRRPEIVRNI